MMICGKSWFDLSDLKKHTTYKVREWFDILLTRLCELAELNRVPVEAKDLCVIVLKSCHDHREEATTT